MATDASTPQTDALLSELLGGCQLSDAASKIVQQARNLELEAAILRRALAATPHAARDQQWKDEVARLLTKVVLFRMALGRESDDCPSDGSGTDVQVSS
jgi:hypothetical protein